MREELTIVRLMSSGEPAAESVATPDSTYPSGRGRRIFFILLFALAVAGAGGYLKWRHDRAMLKRAFALFPGALSEVPLPTGGEPPAERLHEACGVLAKRLDVSAAWLEPRLTKLAEELDSDKSAFSSLSRLERDGASLMHWYLAKNPEDLKILQHRETIALAQLGRDDDGHTINPESEVELRAVLAMRRAVQGKDHPDTLDTAFRVAVDIFLQKRLADAEACGREVLADFERVFRPDPPWSKQGVRRFMASVLSQEGKYAEEEPIRRKLLIAVEREKGADKLEAAQPHVELAKCLQKLGNKEEARNHAQAAVDICNASSGKNDSVALHWKAEALLRELGP